MTKKRAEVALVTGSRRGIGLGIALSLAREGFRIILNATAPEKVAAEAVNAVHAAGAETTYVQADVSRRSDRQRLLKEAKEAFGRVDILVNNAGVSPLVREDILKTSEESFDRLMDINLKGTFFLSQIFATWMIAQKLEHPERSPKVINISSISAYTASPTRGEYCLSKAGISMVTKLFAVRLAEYDIRVYEIRPGIIATDMTKGVRDRYDKLISGGLTPICRWGNPEDIGRAVAAIVLDFFPFSTGEVFNVDGGFHLRRL
jgi:NAD(P)-dependent dehydrogenase (short-subunit alcohol dehydrogenase family)